MSLKLEEIKLNRNQFHRSKQPIYLNQVEIRKIVISDEFKLDDSYGETIKPLCIILPQMNGFIKYFDSNKKACHFWLIMMM